MRDRTLFIISRIGILIVFVLFPILRYTNTPPADCRQNSDEVWNKIEEFWDRSSKHYDAGDYAGFKKVLKEKDAYVHQLIAEGKAPAWLKQAYKP